MHGGELFRGAKGLSFNLGDLATAANGNGHGPIARLADQAAEPAILAPIAERDDTLEALQLGRAMGLVKERIKAGDNELTASALRAGEALGLAIANLITLFAPPRVVLVGSTLVLGEYLMAGLHRALEQAVPRWLADVSEVTVDDADDSAWARGAAAAALLELYGAPWGTTGPARPRNAKHVRDREAP
jgi:predicted NBD/HSP70 family sugar kinase